MKKKTFVDQHSFFLRTTNHKSPPLILKNVFVLLLFAYSCVLADFLSDFCTRSNTLTSASGVLFHSGALEIIYLLIIT